MTAQDHILAWIESSRPHYDRLLEIENFRKGEGKLPFRARVTLDRAAHLVTDAYREMIASGDASQDDPYSAADLACAVALVVAWELES